jgi:hypothetical protein
MTFREAFDRDRPMRMWSFLIGFPIGVWSLIRNHGRELPASAAIIVPMGWVFGVEYLIRFVEWILKGKWKKCKKWKWSLSK